MRTILRRPPRAAAVIAVAAVLTVGVSVAWATTTGGGVITACADKNDLRIDADGTCKKHETAVSFYSKAGADAAFLGAGGTAADSAKLGGLAPGAYLKAGDTAADSAKLGGLAPGAYMKTGDTAADSQKLGGLAPDAYMKNGDTAADSAKLGGLEAGAYLKAGDTAADSAKLGGVPASAYLKGGVADLAGRLSQGAASGEIDLGFVTAFFGCRTPVPSAPFQGSDFVRVTAKANQQLRVVGAQPDGIQEQVFISGGAAFFIAPGTDLVYLALRDDPSRYATITVTHSHENGGCGFIMQSITTG